MADYYRSMVENMPEEADYFVQDYQDNILSIEEMRELYEQQQKEWGVHYKQNTNLVKDEKTGLYRCEYSFLNNGELLYVHLMAEQLYAIKDEVDWQFVTNNYSYEDIERLTHILSNRLAWVPASEVSHQCVVVGKVAREEEPPLDHYDRDVYRFRYDLLQKGLSWFADELPHGERNSTIPEDMLLWNRLAGGRLFSGWNCDLEQNLRWIAENKGASLAADLVERFREDWEDIKTLRLFSIEGASEAAIEKVRRTMFEGIDRQLRIWKKQAEEEKETADTEIETPKVCRYICAEKIKETGARTIEEYTQMLGDACSDAPTLGNMLVQGRRLGYLNFHGDGKSAIYKHLKECYPGKIKFGYPNFTQYFD